MRFSHAELLDQLHEANPIVTLSLPAVWRPDPYQSWTRFATSEQTMTFQDTTRCVIRMKSRIEARQMLSLG